MVFQKLLQSVRFPTKQGRIQLWQVEKVAGGLRLLYVSLAGLQMSAVPGGGGGNAAWQKRELSCAPVVWNQENHMARFFFNLVGSETVRDIEGTELKSLEAARSEAVEHARAIMSDAVLAGFDVSERRIEIHDEAGTLLLVVPFLDALTKRV